MSLWTTIPAPHVPPSALPVLAVGSLKGGVGKTSVVAYLAYALVLSGYRVLVIDLDFQGSLSSALSQALPTNETDAAINVLLASSEEVFFDKRVVSEGYPPWQKLTAVRATFELADVEDRLFAGLILGRSESDARFLLAQKLSEPSLRKDFDIVLIDTPPRLTVGSLNALCACTHVLIPTAPTVLAINGAVTFVDVLERFKKSLGLRLNVLAVLPTLAYQGELSPRETRLLDDLASDIPNVEIWKELHIPRRQAIAENRKFNDPNIEGLFTALALKIEGAMGLTRHGSDTRLRTDRNIRPGGYGLPQ
jgi:cellulose biosynthesis protein BcsQ